MLGLIYTLNDGAVEMLDMPVPICGPNQLLIRTTSSLISSGTERSMLSFGRSSLLYKAKSQPDQVKATLEKISTDGLLPTLEAVSSKLAQPTQPGYCNVGVVIEVGANVSGFQVGDRVVSNSPHAEYVTASPLLCAHIPSDLSDESAVFTVLGSIALNGIRLAKPTLGEKFVVIGLGLIGLLTAQLLQAHGCEVLGIDPDASKCDLARSLGITVLHLSESTDSVQWCNHHTSGYGADGVLITASTQSSDPVETAAHISRHRGRIVLIGVTGLELRRDLFYKKELSFQVSCSYGPGRYDPRYELDCQDYPYGHVRWTQQRNFQAFLGCLSSGRIRTDFLISHRFSFVDAYSAYSQLFSASSFAIILDYNSHRSKPLHSIPLQSDSDLALPFRSSCKPLLGFVGAGNYASRVLIPAFSKAGAHFHTLAASSGLGPVHIGRKFGFRQASCDVPALLSDRSCNTLVIATRHDSHATLVKKALVAGKHVFVEKPLCLTIKELTAIEAAYSGESLLMVGFNRRFSPLVIQLQRQLARLSGPKAFVYTCNAGTVSGSHWTQDPVIGGGRMLGEACHFVDLLRHLAASPIKNLQVVMAADSKPCPDTFSLQLSFVDGSIGTIHYFANGSKSFPKERLEVFADGKVLLLDNFRKLQAWGIPGFRTRRSINQDKGQQACCAAFLAAIETRSPAPIPAEELFEVQRWLLHAAGSE